MTVKERIRQVVVIVLALLLSMLLGIMVTRATVDLNIPVEMDRGGCHDDPR